MICINPEFTIKQYIIVKKRTKILILVAALIVLAICIVVYHHSKHKAKVVPTQEMTVDVAEVVIDSVTLTKTYPGVMAADKAIDIVSRVSGTLQSQGYKDGDMVHPGQVLFRIETSQYSDAVKRSRAALASAQSQYKYAQSHYEAVKKALQSQAASKQEAEQAYSAMLQAQAAIDEAAAELKTAQTSLGYCTITAPARGRVSASTVPVGSMVSGSGTPFTLATLYDDATMKAVFQVDDAELIKIMNARGIDLDHILLKFEDTLSSDYYGNLTYTAPDVNSSTGAVELKAVVANPKGELRDGMYVSVSLPYGFDPNAILVQDASIASDQLGKYVYVVNKENKVVYTPIKIGELANDSMRIVTQGLQPGDRYVTKALLKVRDGMQVKPRMVK